MVQTSYLFYYCLVNYIWFTNAFSIRNGEDAEQIFGEKKKIIQETDTVRNHNQVIDASAPFQSPPQPAPQIPNTHTASEHHLKRIKRQTNANVGASWLKYVWRERQFKIPQMWLTHIRNLWAVDPIGGKTCFDPDIPYGSVYLFKTLILDALFPRIGKNQ